jgi:hypothetical protein
MVLLPTEQQEIIKGNRIEAEGSKVLIQVYNVLANFKKFFDDS